MEYFRLTRFKFLCTLFILLAGWIANWISDSVMGAVFQSMNQEYIERLGNVMNEMFEKGTSSGGAVFQDPSFAWLTFLKASLAILFAYVGSCVLEALVESQYRQKSNRSLQTDAEKRRG